MGIRQLPSGRFRLQIRRAGLSVDEVFDSKDAATAAMSKYLRPDPTGIGVPAKLAESLLVHLRNEEQRAGLDDSGGELLYETQTLQKLSSMAARLGSDEGERMRKLVEIQRKLAQRQGGKTKAAPTSPGTERSERSPRHASRGKASGAKSAGSKASSARKTASK